MADAKAAGDSAEKALLRDSVRDALAAGADWAQLDELGLWSTIEPPDGSLAMAMIVAEELGRARYAGPAYETMVAIYVRSGVDRPLDIDPGAAPAAVFVCGTGDLDPIVAVPPGTLLLVATGDAIAAVRSADAEISEQPSLDVGRRTVLLSVPPGDVLATDPGLVRSARGIRVPRDAETERIVRQWYSDLFEAGYLGGSWPREYGGVAEHSPQHDAVVMEEIVRARAPRPIDQVMLAAHLVITFGTPEQKNRYLPRIRSAEDIWCQLLSEPGVGSDLARLSTKATRQPDGTFRVDGQKVWTTDGQWSQMGVLLARTDPDAPRPHAGLTTFVVDMSTPGIDVRPIREMTGSDEFCEVYFDGAVLPADSVLGELNQGWAVANSGLASERAYVGANAVMLELLFDDLIELARAVELPADVAIADPVVREALSDFQARVAGVQLIARSAVAKVAAGTDAPADGMIAKLAYTERNVALCMYAITLATSASVTSRRRRGVPALAAGVPVVTRADDLGRLVGDRAQRPGHPASGTSPVLVRRAMTDREAIDDLIAAYALTLDADDIEGCLALFTEDCEYLVFGKTLLGPEKVRKTFNRAPRGMHLTGASLVTVQGRTAMARTQVLFVDSSDHGMRPALYDDDLVKVDGTWRFRRRRCQFLTTQGLSDAPQEQPQ